MNEKKKILIYDDKLFGHHLEYIHHLHDSACDNKNIEFIFAVPVRFNEVKNELIWKKSDNVKYHFLSNKETILTGNVLVQSFKKSRIVRKVASYYSVDEVFFIAMMGFLPLISFFLPKNIKISGIIYSIYLYRWNKSTKREKLLDSLKYLLLSQRNNFKCVFILNDKYSTIYLNRKFKTSKFSYLVDPYLPLDENNLINIREKYSIPYKNIVYSHFGDLTARKGTMKILDAIDLLDEYELKNKTFIFAGKIKNDIKIIFYEKYKSLKNKVQILCFDEFCEYNFLGSITSISDFILLPYLNTAQSSGLIGYGAQFKIPVVVPNSGLLGKLVKKYHLGYTIDICTGEKLADFISHPHDFNISYKKESDYINEHSVTNFTETVLKKMM